MALDWVSCENRMAPYQEKPLSGNLKAEEEWK